MSANFVCLFPGNGFAEFPNPPQKEIPQPGKTAQERDYDTSDLRPFSPSQDIALRRGQLSLNTSFRFGDTRSLQRLNPAL